MILCYIRIVVISCLTQRLEGRKADARMSISQVWSDEIHTLIDPGFFLHVLNHLSDGHDAGTAFLPGH
eukprot:Skav214924  [mRNA]  locus=scaffold2073:211334:212899:+ [translate_table: standard]